MGNDLIPLDSNWLRANPLPQPDRTVSKNERGRVLTVGGSREVPGGIQLTAEAALRVGAGKVRIVTVECAATAIGVAMPEVAVTAMPETEDGEIAHFGEISGKLGEFDAVIAGPAMTSPRAGAQLVDRLLDSDWSAVTLVLDAATLLDLVPRIQRLRERRSPAILTPHLGEMAALMGCEIETIEADCPAAARSVAEQTGAVVVLKGPTSYVASPDGAVYAYPGGGVGLATGGSGDVLAGIAGGLAARGADPVSAAVWSVWLHGEAGRRCAEAIGPLGFLARELLAQMPRLMLPF